MRKAYLKLLFYIGLLCISIYLLGIKTFHLIISILGRSPEHEPIPQHTISNYIIPDSLIVVLSLIVISLSIYKILVKAKYFFKNK